MLFFLQEMATASEKLESTSERENFQRLDRLNLDGCTALLRDLFDSIIHPSTLAATLATNEKVLKTKAKLTRVEKEILFPASGCVVTSEKFDISLLSRLLRCICNLTMPPSGWDDLPEVDDVTIEAELVRFKYYRNFVHGHERNSKVTQMDFQSLWQNIRASMLAIATYVKNYNLEQVNFEKFTIIDIQ